VSDSIPIRTTQADTSAGMIDLALGHPSPSLLPLEIMCRAAEHRLRRGGVSYLQYGYEQGDGYFRLALANFLQRHYRVPVSADQLFVSGGVSQALDLICTLYCRPGDTIFVEDPSYFLALRIFADHGLRVQSLPTDGRGLIVEALEEKLAETVPVFLYTIPAHQNPSGASLCEERRLRLAELSQKHGFFIVADEVYHLLTYEGQAPAPMAGLISLGKIISLGSFSKILAPGLRLGWVQADETLLRPLLECGLLDSGGGLNPFTSGIVRSILELGLQEEHLSRLRKEYGRRRLTMSSALRAVLPPAVNFSEPSGGFFFWLNLPDDLDASSLLEKAVARHVRFLPGSPFSPTGRLKNCLRLSFSYYSSEELQEGVRRLSDSLAAFFS